MPKNKKPAGRPNFDPSYAKKSGHKPYAKSGSKPGSRSAGHRGYRPEDADSTKKRRWTADERAARGLAAERPRGGSQGERSRDDRQRDDRPYRGRDERTSRSYDSSTRSARSGDRRQFDDRPRRDYGDDRSRRQYSEDRPRRDYNEDRPRRQYDDAPRRRNEDAPRRSYRDDAPRRDQREDRPRRDYNEDRPRRDYNEDRPRREYSDDRPRRQYSEDRPRRDYGDDRPRRSYGDDRPRRNNDDRPRRSFNDDRPRRYGDDRRTDAPRERRESSFYPNRDERPAFTSNDDVVLERLEAEAIQASDVDGVTFGDLGLGGNIVRALAELGAESPFPIQAATIPDVLSGRDVLGRGRTGSGKTIAFGAPLVERLMQLWAESGRANGKRTMGRSPRA
ncbi:MAG: DEAD/DEAH box helicase, partial [Humibacter sp.]